MAKIPKEYLFNDKSAGKEGTAVYRLMQIDNDGKTTSSKEVELTLAPVVFDLEQNYPNPFNPTTTIRYSLPSQSRVNISVYDILGNKTGELVNSVKEAGSYDAEFNAGRLASGIYLYKIEVNSIVGSQNFSSTKKMLFLK